MKKQNLLKILSVFEYILFTFSNNEKLFKITCEIKYKASLIAKHSK